MGNKNFRKPYQLFSLLTLSILLCGVSIAQSSNVKGVINGRTGATMTVQSQDGGNVTVVLTPSTTVEEPQGLFREKHLAMTALIPGLVVDVKGSYNAQNQLVADDVKFSGNSLKAAEDIQAGLAPTKEQVEQNQMKEQAEQKELHQEQMEQAQHQQELLAEQKKIAANKAAIAAANKRFGELAEYNILGEVRSFWKRPSDDRAAV